MPKTTRPLAGLTVLITRPVGRGDALRGGLERLGAAVRHIPAIRIAPPRSWRRLDDALRRPEGFDWVLFTSAYGVESYFARLKALRLKPKARRIGVVGPKTAEAVRAHGARVDAIAAEHRSEALVPAMGDELDMKVLLAVAEKSRPELPRLLRHEGAKVTIATAYRNLQVPGAKAKLRSLTRRRRADLVVFTSPSTAQNMASAVGKTAFRRFFRYSGAVSIGPVTTAALKELGVKPVVEAKVYTAEGLLAALKDYER